MSFQIPTDSVLFPLSTYITGKVIGKIIKKKMNPNISALFTFPNKRFPGNPGSRPEPAWSLVPDAIMVNSPFVDIQEVFFVANNKKSYIFVQTLKIYLFAILKYLQVCMQICIRIFNRQSLLRLIAFWKYPRNPILVRILTTWLAFPVLAKNLFRVGPDGQKCWREGDEDWLKILSFSFFSLILSRWYNLEMRQLRLRQDIKVERWRKYTTCPQ